MPDRALKFIGYMPLFILAIGFLLIPLVTQAAAPPSLINILSEEVAPKKTVKVFESDGTKTDFTKLLSKKEYIDGYGKSQRVDIDDKVGVEWISYAAQGPSGANQLIVIKSDASKVLKAESVFKGNKGRKAEIAVGDLYSKWDGPEIAVCKRRSLNPKVKIYRYTAGGNFRLVESFSIFGGKKAFDRGCQNIAIGDMDKDGANDLVIQRYRDKTPRNAHIKVYSTAGDVVSTFKDTSNNINLLGAGDFLDRGSVQMAIKDNDVVMIFDSEWKKRAHIDLSKWLPLANNGVGVGDVDGDGIHEIVLMKAGRLAKVKVLNWEGIVESKFKAFPKANFKRVRHLIIGQD